MDERLFLPIIGVAIGWLLNTASAYSKYRFEYKTHSGKALAYLIVILDQIELINVSLEKWKDHVKSWKEFESLREYSMRRHFLAAEELSQNAEKAFLELASYDPIFANHLLAIKNGLSFHRTIKLNEAVKNQKVYIEALSSLETVMLLTEKSLKKDTLRLARQHSLMTWINLKKRMYRIEKQSGSRLFEGLYENYKAFRDGAESTASNKEVVTDAGNDATLHTPHTAIKPQTTQETKT